MLSLMQFAAGAALHAAPGPRDALAAGLLVGAGWLNFTPYLWRAVGVNAFVLAGGALQRSAALLSLLGTVALTAGWLLLLVQWAA